MATSPTSLVANWSPPVISNGIVSEYMVSHRQLQLGGCNEKTKAWSHWRQLDPGLLNPYCRIFHLIPDTRSECWQKQKLGLERKLWLKASRCQQVS
jgi:hypothetical protein